VQVPGDGHATPASDEPPIVCVPGAGSVDQLRPFQVSANAAASDPKLVAPTAVQARG
jgi:hypothetical protein